MAGPRQDRDLPKVKLNAESLKELKFLFKYLKPYRKYFFGGLLFISLSALSTMAFPFLMGKMINAVSGKSVEIPGNTLMNASNGVSIMDVEWTLNFVLLLIFIQLTLQTIFSFMRVFLLTKAGVNATADLRKDLYSNIISLPMSFFSSQRVGDLSSRLSADTGQIQDVISVVLAEFLRGVLTLVIGVSLIFVISWKLALIMLSVVPLIALSAVFFGMRIKKMSRRETDMLAESSNVVHETLQGISVVKAFTAESLERNRYSKNINSLIDFALKSGVYRGFFVSFIIFSVFGAISFVIWYGAGIVQTNPKELQIGQLMMFVIYSVFVGGTLGGFADMFGQLQKALGSIQRVRELLAMDKEESAAATTDVKRLNGDITFTNVAFSYPSRAEVQVLKDISFTVSKGQQIAIVGSSGGGKSTIASLVLKFYTPDAGTIAVDGKDANDYDLKYLRSQIAYVPQDVILFGGTIYENILYGNPEATKEQVIEAARRANALQFIQSFPQQFETMVGERGIQLSGGQKQRVAIARAILKDPAILVLDEATSALDSESEQLVQDALEDLMKHRTSIVIAHRLSTIRSADNIIVLDKGTIVEQGKHEELIKIEEGVYKNLNQLQLV
ncbi:MAG: ABC transporter ATP-binding protein [Bacteroidota bacterium]